ncbi:hypothetical protein [Conexibacter woesei]|uniref:Uncharacterized protein n=1 Tax=Conexibacter woesei (strain DSM 14684 / CCUG 47730 / CIP 108061 / JCM 11494 / NBRC 100937 / ID131577) TaxID=469383 RepID=D3F507_CONWI|nr:hypothetical protein [Conexibacter woesei]ADB48585.1 hypothetical protein Cwoe_0149 [Conexibacter woesei DSM 14684]
MTTDLPPRLARLGDALEQAASADLAGASSAASAPASARARTTAGRGRRPRRIALFAAAIAIAIPGAAIAGSQLIDTDEVADSIPAGSLWLAGTEPSCTVVRENVEFHCTLGKAPSGEVLADWKGTVEPTVDASKRVNGGCRSLASDGRSWRCYIGSEAVEQRIIGAGFLGDYAPTPGAG